MNPQNKIHRIPGIYAIINIISNKAYIGSSVRVSSRINNHFASLKINKHANAYLQRSFNKYGINNFKVEILEYCDKSILLEREQYYLDNIENSFNILKKAYSSIGYKHTKETRKKLKESWKKNPRKNTEEQKNKIRESLKGRKPWNLGKKASEETKSKMIKSRTGKTKCKLSIDEILDLYKTYKSIKGIQKHTNINFNVIKRFLINNGYNYLNPLNIIKD